VAAKNMLGAHVSYDKIPYFFSDQYEIGMEYTAWPTPPARSSSEESPPATNSSPSG
jgi:hypothetical protein